MATEAVNEPAIVALKTLNGGIPMRCLRIRVIGLVAIALTIAPSTFAQTVAVAQLSGTVNDESNAALPGVDVSVTQTSTGMTRSVVTGSRGEYVFTNLPVGDRKRSCRERV